MTRPKRRLWLALGPTLALWALSAGAAQAGQCTVYEHRGFAGASSSIGDGESRPILGQRWNDRISAIACERGCILTAWEHAGYAGSRKRFDGAVDFVGNRWNDRISSFRVRCDSSGAGSAGEAGQACILYEDRNFKGRSTTVSSGMSADTLGGLNNRVSSVSCGNGCSLTVFDRAGFKGEKTSLSGRLDFVGHAWNDRISSAAAFCFR